MTEKQEQFLYLAVIKKWPYDKIAIKLDIERKVFSSWWNELVEERKKLVEIRDKWQVKCPDIEFENFRDWFERTKKECYYCGISEKQLAILWDKQPNLTKRKRGKKLEIERLEPNEPYSNTENLVFSCYWCNNAKTDTFTKDEFVKVGKVIQQIWEERLK